MDLVLSCTAGGLQLTPRAAAATTRAQLEQPPVSQSAQPEEVLAAVSPQLASLSFRGGGFACLRETAAAESGSSVKPNGALFASLSL